MYPETSPTLPCSITSGTFGDGKYFQDLVDNVNDMTKGNDWFLVANDFATYMKAQDEVDAVSQGVQMLSQDGMLGQFVRVARNTCYWRNCCCSTACWVLRFGKCASVYFGQPCISQ